MEPETTAQLKSAAQPGDFAQPGKADRSESFEQPEYPEDELVQTVAEDKRMPKQASTSSCRDCHRIHTETSPYPGRTETSLYLLAPIPGLTQQITEALDIAQESACERTSKSGNIVVTGRRRCRQNPPVRGPDKSHLQGAPYGRRQIAYLDAEKMNERRTRPM